MFARLLLISAALALASCDRAGLSPDKAGEAPQLESPAPESEPTRAFAPTNDAARTTTGALSVSMAQRMPDAAHSGDAPKDVLSLTGTNHLQIEAELTNAVTPATLVDGQTLRALLAIPVEEPQVLVYRVVSETKPESGGGLCGAGAPAFVVVWEPSTAGEPVLKALGITGAAPGASGARPCTLLEYRRS